MAPAPSALCHRSTAAAATGTPAPFQTGTDPGVTSSAPPGPAPADVSGSPGTPTASLPGNPPALPPSLLGLPTAQQAQGSLGKIRGHSSLSSLQSPWFSHSFPESPRTQMGGRPRGEGVGFISEVPGLLRGWMLALGGRSSQNTRHFRRRHKSVIWEKIRPWCSGWRGEGLASEGAAWRFGLRGIASALFPCRRPAPFQNATSPPTTPPSRKARQCSIVPPAPPQPWPALPRRGGRFPRGMGGT